MADSGQEKTEQPTPRKLQEARKKGQVAKSKDLSSAVVLMAAVSFFYLFRQNAIASLSKQLSWYFNNCFTFNLPADKLYSILVTTLLEFILVFVPLFLIIMAFGILANVMQTGFVFSSEAVSAKLERLNPIEGFKRLISVDSLVELLKSVIKVVIVGVISYLAAAKYIPKMLMIYFKKPEQEIQEIASVLLVVASAGGATFLILAIMDFYYQRFSFLKKMKMTMQEVKDEYKNTEGDPEIKGWLRRRQREVVMNRITQEVPKATVVLTNPIHYAVALKYEDGVSNAPVVTAKGAGDVAFKIKDIAASHKVPVIENPPLAKALFQQVDLGHEIPAGLYQAVAEVLAMVYRLKRKQY